MATLKDYKGILRSTNANALLAIPKTILEEFCGSIGLKTDGTKENLAQRIVQRNTKQNNPETSEKTSQAAPELNENLRECLSTIRALLQTQLSFLEHTQTSAHPVKVIATQPDMTASLPTFSGHHDEHFEQWLTYIKRAQEHHKRTDATTLAVGQTKLQGREQRWNEAAGNNHPTWKTWEKEIRQIFEKRSTIMQWAKIVIERTQKPDEDIASYLFTRLRIAEDCPCKLTNADKLSCVPHGCNNRNVLNIITAQFCLADFDITDAIKTAIDRTLTTTNEREWQRPPTNPTITRQS